MTLLSPIWLLVVIPLALALWLFRPPSRLLLAFRASALVLIVLALAGMSIRLPSRAGTVVIVADRSLSMPGKSEAEQKEAIDLIQSKMSSEDRLAVVSFGQSVAVEHPPGTGPFGGFVNQVGGNASSLGEAMDTALSLIPRDSPGRVFVLSDGKWTGRDPASLTPVALARNIAIDYRSHERPAVGDLAVARIDAPTVVSANESFLMNAWVYAPAPQLVKYELKKGDTVIATGEKQMVSGNNRITFRDRATIPGNQGYTLVISGTEKDPIPENNTAKILVGVGGPRPILHVSENADSGLAKLLTAGGLRIRSLRPQQAKWTLEELSRYSGVVLENTQADRIGHVGMETLAAWVKETGSGLMMTGGRSGYGPGGYYKSPLEAIMPVSMELRNEHRKLSLAIVVALDRSGSMSAAVGGGKKKMDLANLGAAQVIDLLNAQDEFGCLAVDTTPHEIAPLGLLTDKESIRSKVLRVESQGGGIYAYEALSAASKMLLKAKAGTKHIILFSDAADTEQPGDYINLLANCEKAGITVSVIALGKESDQDAELCKDIAKRGKGRFFITDKPEELPRVFAQDTFVVARNTFIDDPTAIKHTPGLKMLTDQELPTPKNLGLAGYNLCYLRPGANLGGVTLDEYGAPVLASWRAGAGRVVCYTGEADGKYAGNMAKWDRVGDYFTSLARWTAGATGPMKDNMLLTQEVREGVNVIQLHLDPERKGDPFAGLPKVNTLRSLPGFSPRREGAVLRWTGADTLSLEVPLDGGETTLTTVEIPGHGPVSLSPVCLPYSPEFKPTQPDRGTIALERLAKATGGKERVELPSIWQDLPRQVRMMAIGRWLMLAAVVFLILEVFERRTSILSNLLRRRRRIRESVSAEKKSKPLPAVKVKKTPVTVAVPKSPSAETPPSPAAQPIASASPVVRKEDAVGLTDALRKARQRASKRVD